MLRGPGAIASEIVGTRTVQTRTQQAPKPGDSRENSRPSARREASRCAEDTCARTLAFSLFISSQPCSASMLSPADLRCPIAAAVAQMLANGRRRQSWLKKSLGTKSRQEAKLRGKPVLMGFDRAIERARELAKEVHSTR